MKKSLLIAFLSIFISFNSAKCQDITDVIAKTISSGSSKELAKYFNTNIDLAIPDYEGMFSKAQAEVIIKDFFTKHAVQKFTIIHKGSSKDKSQFTIGKLNTSKGNYRVMFLLKKVTDKSQIQQFRIEPED